MDQKNRIDFALNDWNESYSRNFYKLPKVDKWLEAYKSILEQAKDHITFDLGCGAGGNTNTLKLLGLKVVSADYSIEALRKIRKCFNSNIVHFDYRNDCPFKSAISNLVVADLSIHYFYWDVTVKIVDKINNILRDGGYFLCRVNSIKDVNYGAGQGNEIEHHYFEREGRYKRFFDKSDIDSLFPMWNMQVCKEYTTYRYDDPKVVWEIVLRKI